MTENGGRSLDGDPTPVIEKILTNTNKINKI